MESSSGEFEPQGKDFRIFNKEVLLKNGETIQLPGMHVQKMTLYHGSPVAGITSLAEAEETTVGNGAYLTSQKEAAIGYAKIRSTRQNNTPIVYEAIISDINIANLSTADGISGFSQLLKGGLITKLEKWRKAASETGDLPSWTVVELASRNIDKIDKNTYDSLKDLTFSFGHLTRELLTKEGFGGLMTYEGGENSRNISIGTHDSFVIFNPKRAQIVKEEFLPRESK